MVSLPDLHTSTAGFTSFIIYIDHLVQQKFRDFNRFLGVFFLHKIRKWPSQREQDIAPFQKCRCLWWTVSRLLFVLCLTVTRWLGGFPKGRKAVDGILDHPSLVFSLWRLEIQTQLLSWPPGCSGLRGVRSSKGSQVFGHGAPLPGTPPPPPGPDSSSTDTTRFCGPRNPGGRMQDPMYVRRGREKVPRVYPVTWFLSVTEIPSELECRV